MCAYKSDCKGRCNCFKNGIPCTPLYKCFEKIGLLLRLGVSCLVLFLLVGMLFSNVSVWQLNCYKVEKSLRF